MDGNKDDALKCLKIGRDALEIGDRARALKFFTKARHLNPNLPVDDLLAAIEEDSGEQSAAAAAEAAAEAAAGRRVGAGLAPAVLEQADEAAGRDLLVDAGRAHRVLEGDAGDALGGHLEGLGRSVAGLAPEDGEGARVRGDGRGGDDSGPEVGCELHF